MTFYPKVFYPGQLVQFKQADYCAMPQLAWMQFVVVYCEDMQANTYTIALHHVQLNDIRGEYLELCK